MTRVDKIKTDIMDRLQKGLPGHLFYHGIDHTLDVLNAVQRIGTLEKISDIEMELLQVAALYHDCGFLVKASGHEAIACDFAREELPSYNFNQQDIATICDLIMATKVPQQPSSTLEKILCDADLDYLGRFDFHDIAKKLYQELQSTGVVSSEAEWNRMQINFLSNHRYFTQTSISSREPLKAQHLEALKLLEEN
jgi:predicted metal-dependent HD superfamily phosphohydrolase